MNGKVENVEVAMPVSTSNGVSCWTVEELDANFEIYYVTPFDARNFFLWIIAERFSK